MVSKSSNKRKTIKKIIVLVSLAIIEAGIVIGLGYLILIFKSKIITPETEPPETEGITEVVSEDKTAPEIPKTDFQPVVDEWATSTGGNKSVLIYDIERDEIVGEYNTDENYNTASLYKLFVVYEGYRRLQNGTMDANAMAGTTGHTILECLNLAIRESHSPCAETLWGIIGHDELDNIIASDFNITNSEISHLISNPKDIAAMMKIYYNHTDIKNEGLIRQMKESFLIQPTTNYYNWRQGLPSGFYKANVYNKVGWDYNPDGKYWNIYHDAAIIEFPEENRHFIVVVMTNHVDFKNISRLGTMIENKFYQ